MQNNHEFIERVDIMVGDGSLGMEKALREGPPGKREVILCFICLHFGIGNV